MIADRLFLLLWILVRNVLLTSVFSPLKISGTLCILYANVV